MPRHHQARAAGSECGMRLRGGSCRVHRAARPQEEPEPEEAKPAEPEDPPADDEADDEAELEAPEEPEAAAPEEVEP